MRIFQMNFDKIKQYLYNPPLLILLEPRRPLILYLTIMETVIGYVLGEHDDLGRKEQVIYYWARSSLNVNPDTPS